MDDHNYRNIFYVDIEMIAKHYKCVPEGLLSPNKGERTQNLTSRDLNSKPDLLLTM